MEKCRKILQSIQGFLELRLYHPRGPSKVEETLKLASVSVRCGEVEREKCVDQNNGKRGRQNYQNFG